MNLICICCIFKAFLGHFSLYFKSRDADRKQDVWERERVRDTLPDSNFTTVSVVMWLPVRPVSSFKPSFFEGHILGVLHLFAVEQRQRDVVYFTAYLTDDIWTQDIKLMIYSFHTAH